VWYIGAIETSLNTPLTPEQLAAVNAGGGFAQVEDPTTHRTYYLIEQGAPPTIDDDYVREKIVEAYEDGEFKPLDMAAIKAEFHRRQALKNRRRD
jgi:hypothetical protein